MFRMFYFGCVPLLYLCVVAVVDILEITGVMFTAAYLAFVCAEALGAHVSSALFAFRRCLGRLQKGTPPIFCLLLEARVGENAKQTAN